nr:protein MAIN-LIKE 1-like [Cicer arietinum]
MNPPERIRPTASRRRRRMIIEDDDEGHNDQGEPSTVHEEDVVHEHMVHEQVDVHEQEEAAPAHEGEHMEEEHDGPEGPGELTRYPGGPYDLYVLTRYRYHVSARLWFGEERPLLKIVAHGKKMQQFTPPVLPRPIENWVNLSGLNPLQRGSLKMIDNNLISAFVERWHSETSSFHMPFGEMTITLDDVANLLGLPIRGEFYSPPDVDRVTACNLAVHLLGVTTEEIWEETRKTRGAHYRLDWLKEVFRRQCAAERFDCAARAYLLNLVGSTIFADKSHTLVDAKYLPLFRYLDGIDRYAWGTAALVVLYDYLSDACYYDTKQLGGYMTLLQCWIYEYFPNICNRGDQGADVECFARMNRWCYKQGKHKVHEYRSIIDALTPADVIWRPWENHRGVIPFDDITLYTGHIRLCSTVAKYLPERCLRQFGYIQYIPSPPLPDPARLFDVDVEWLGYVTPVTELFPKLRPATYPSECEDGYLEWFYQVSHPLLVRPDGVPQVPRYSVPPTSADASSSQPPPILQQIGDLIQQGLSEHQASPDDELYRHFYKALYLSRSRTS